MQREEKSQDEHEIDRNRNQEDRESNWEESRLCSEKRIPKEYHREEYIDPESDDRSECRLEYSMKRDEIVEKHTPHEHEKDDRYIDLRHLECLSKRREYLHENVGSVRRIL
jgi:hypothetical protein